MRPLQLWLSIILSSGHLSERQILLKSSVTPSVVHSTQCNPTARLQAGGDINRIRGRYYHVIKVYLRRVPTSAASSSSISAICGVCAVFDRLHSRWPSAASPFASALLRLFSCDFFS
ncbi:hypothetical protein L596_002157 [Steinernema carpocapsae]|uniref:Uncharacterized protein n=1 Tax=Steinernema carpocapsae TaxID=34508 RepID=A0A4U8UNP0_STECR|nr:hypothetical protein L596_002157 [Steinernema carpocapsae]